MAMSTRETFIKLDIKAATGKNAVFLKTKLLEEGKEGFELTLTDGQVVWKGKVDPEDMDDMKDKTKMDYNSFVVQTASAFTQEGESVEMFQFAASKKKDTVVLTWKKHIPSEDITFQLGTVTLVEVKNAQKELCDLLCYFINCMTELNSHIQTLQSENERLSKDRSNALKRLQKCVDMKEEFEEEMYSKFVAVLNAKKEKIRQLKAQVDETPTSVGPNYDPQPSTSKAVDRRHKRTHKVASSENNSQDLFADEDSSPERKSFKSKKSSYGSDESKNDHEDESLVLDDSDSSSNLRAAKRPTRQRSGNTKQTPSKPVLPKVTTKQKPKTSPVSKNSTPRRSSIRGSKGSENIDADELLEQLCG